MAAESVSAVGARARLACWLALVVVVAHAVGSEAQQPQPKPECASRCFEHNCNSVDLRYGKYCGVGHGGCPGEKPCDAADACCQEHDDCVGRAGVLATQCHTDFLVCLDQVMLSGKKGFSKTCPYSTVIPTMQGGIQLTMMLGDAFGGAFGGQLRMAE